MTKETDKILVLPETAHRYSLRPVFALNRALREVRIMARAELESLGENHTVPHIVPYLFNKRSRTFLTYGFTDEAMDTRGERAKEILSGNNMHHAKQQKISSIYELVDNIDSNPKFSVKQWRHYLEHVKTSNPGNEKKIKEYLKLQNEEEFKKSLKSFTYEEWMDIYVHHLEHQDMHLNGRFFNLLHDVYDKKIDPFDALAFNVKNRSSETMPGREMEVHGLSTRSENAEAWIDLGEGKQNLGGKDSHSRGEQIHFALTTLFALPNKIPPWVLLIPIYDNYIAGQGFGGICATLQIPCYGELDLENRGAAAVTVRKLISCVPILSLEIAASGVERAIRDKVKDRHTAISEFVSGLRYLQDWECIEVIFSNPSENSLFKHTKTGCADSKLLPSKSGITITQKATLSWSRGAEKDHVAAADNVDLEYIAGMEKNLSELSGLEKVVFHFPKYFRLPERPIDANGAEIETPYWQAYCDDLIRQQRELLSVLMPKLRARKAALRSAVSAIMGRNMSHNIGSHVLARYSNEVKNDNQGTDGKLKDPREDFLRYLQRRMDFIAEVATADQSFWSQALSIEGALDTLNLDKEKAAINGINGGGTRKPILLSYITGKEFKEGPLTATVEIDPATNGDHRFFACPSGEVGVHALYVILENIIRNSARHNENPPCPITVLVKIEEEKQHPDLWKLTLTDLQTQISENKCVHDEINKNLDTQILDKDGAPNPKYWGIREMQVCAQYLRNLPLSDLEGPQSVPPILKAVNNEDRLAYVLYVPRAKLCVMASKSPLVSETQKKILRAQGFDFVSSEDKTDAELADALRGYAYAVIEEDVQGTTQVSTIAKLPNSNSENWVKKIDWPVRTLCMSKGRLEELISSLSDQTENIQGQGTVSDGAAFDPMKWLEDELHNRLMTEYKNRRGYLAEKEVAVKVGWGDSNGITLANGKFEHTKIDCLKNWEGIVDPLLCWIDHAKAVYFTGSPFLRAACEETVVRSQLSKRTKTISSWIYAEVIRSHSPHHHDLKRQLAKIISGNELIAAALAKVVIIDERVQSMAGEKNDEIEYSTLWSCMGIGVPSTEEANLNFPTFDAICSFLKKPTKLMVNMPIDFVVLHLTILEKLAQELHRCDEQSALSQLISCAGLSPSCEVVIVTGRGVPAVARHEDSKRLNARYLPISALLEYLVSNPSKLAVMRALWSAATSKTTE